MTSPRFFNLPLLEQYGFDVTPLTKPYRAMRMRTPGQPVHMTHTCERLTGRRTVPATMVLADEPLVCADCLWDYQQVQQLHRVQTALEWWHEIENDPDRIVCIDRVTSPVRGLGTLSYALNPWLNSLQQLREQYLPSGAYRADVSAVLARLGKDSLPDTAAGMVLWPTGYEGGPGRTRLTGLGLNSDILTVWVDAMPSVEVPQGRAYRATGDMYALLRALFPGKGALAMADLDPEDSMETLQVAATLHLTTTANPASADARLSAALGAARAVLAAA